MESYTVSIVPGRPGHCRLKVERTCFQTTQPAEVVKDNFLFAHSLKSCIGILEVTTTADVPVGTGRLNAMPACLKQCIDGGKVVAALDLIDGDVDHLTGQRPGDKDLLSILSDGKSIPSAYQLLNEEAHHTAPQCTLQ